MENLTAELADIPVSDYLKEQDKKPSDQPDDIE